MVSQQYLEKMQQRQAYRNLWHTDLLNTITADCPYCSFALFCGPCASYLLRKRALYNDMSRYVCCAGYMPCSGNCGERKCPEFCLCTEVFCCFANSVASTRFLLQDEFNIQTTKCDNCIIGCMVCLQQTQHKVELDKRDGKFGPVMQAPPAQHMSRIDVGVPPPVGYAPSYPTQTSYGQPAYQQPSQQPYGYPAQGYSSSAYPPQNYPKY